MPYYTKLPIVLLSEIAAAREDSYRARMASYLLEHMGQSLTAEEIARDCFVSKSAVSRFCREIGLEDFGELKELLSKTDKNFERIGADLSEEERFKKIARRAGDAMTKCAETLDRAALSELVRLIRTSERIACFGLLKAEAAAINLQSDLTMLGLKALTKVSYRDQMDFLRESGPSDLIIIFSYQGIYFEYDLPAEIREGKGRIFIVTGNPAAKEKLLQRPLVRGVLCFSSDLDFISHPYQLLAASSIIAQEVAAAE
ncbi:MAG: MurR/RpiR family transcriptional regulator [Firmicutes bacterium]|nr:MurR/RpiR family transcriptional regulator [Bacillota bacterium]